MEEIMYNEKEIIAQWNADMYDLNRPGIADVAFVLNLMGAAPKKVLEIACGSGRILLPVAKAGHDVTGLDFDEYMLEKIGPKIAGEKLKWRRADVVSEEWGTGFDVVILGDNFLLNIVSDMDYEQSQKLMIQKSADALAVGGHIFVDYGYTQYPEKWFAVPGEHVIWEGTDSRGNSGKWPCCITPMTRRAGWPGLSAGLICSWRTGVFWCRKSHRRSTLRRWNRYISGWRKRAL